MPTKDIKKQKKSKEATLNLHFLNAMEDPHTRIEYIRKKDRSKRGVMISCKDPLNEDRVLIGFSMCRLAYDKFDHLEGRVAKKDFGKMVAFKRAMKYANLSSVMVHFIAIDAKNPLVVYIPQTVHESLDNFIQAAYKYYKGASFPEWVNLHYPMTLEDEVSEKSSMMDKLTKLL